MDHVLEHGEEPIPDMSGVTESASSAPMDVDDEDDAAMAVPEGAEAKARPLITMPYLNLTQFTEHQVH